MAGPGRGPGQTPTESTSETQHMCSESDRSPIGDRWLLQSPSPDSGQGKRLGQTDMYRETSTVAHCDGDAQAAQPCALRLWH